LKKILILKIGAIGDVVMSLPLIPEIRKTHPDARITWLCGKQVKPMLERVEGIDELIEVDEHKALNPSPLKRIPEILRIWNKLAMQHFDLQLYFYRSPLYRILTLPVRFGETRGFGDSKCGSRLPVIGRHHSMEYIRAFRGQGGPDEISPEYPVFRGLNRRSEPGRPRQIVFACGGARNILQNNDLRRWPLESYRKLAEMAIDAGHQVILSGGPSDSWVKDGFHGLPCQDMIGKLNLNGFIDFLATADLLVTHDSGPLHLADLAQCPVLGLFGPTRPSDFRSLQEKSRFIWGGEQLCCRPCYDGKDYGNCTDNQCLKSIGPAEVFQRLQEMLKP
jgi:heptosyltransferase-2